ncbi:MAG: glycerate kinase [Collinsella sp.]
MLGSRWRNANFGSVPRPRRALLAIDSFKGSVSSSQASRRLSRRAPRGPMPRCALPLADGGEGTLDAVAAVAASSRPVRLQALRSRICSDVGGRRARVGCN